MAYNTLSPIRQQPYYAKSGMGLVKKKEEDESSHSTATAEAREEEHQHQAKVDQNTKKSGYEQLKESKLSNKMATASRDANLKNSAVNIAQILKDFRNTAKAIGASPELTEEVNDYLALVEKQVTKENPDTKVVRSTLKNASLLLDNYISETLQRSSNVVENWIEALFLQQINYKFNEEEVNQQFLVKFPNKKNGEDENSEEKEDNEEGNQNEKAKIEKIINVPQDEELKSLFIQAKKHSYANNTQKAMEFFKAALVRSITVEDRETESKVLFEIGKIYDKGDYLVQALTSYNRSLLATTDNSIKTQAHYSMAQIYDDVAQFEPAMNHYMSSISYAGENENLIAQSTSLSKIGGMYSDKYKTEAFDFLSEAELIAIESKDAKTKGYVSSNIANAYNKFNKPQKALKYYHSAVKEYQDADSPLKVAINYKRAAELMIDYKNDDKARSLMQKALTKARQTDDVQLMKEIHEALGRI